MKKIIIFLMISVSLFAQDRMRLNEIQGSPSFESTDLETEDKFLSPYLVLPVPGAGFSYRWNGNAVDVSIGLFSGSSYSKIVYFQGDKLHGGGFYGSMGAGGGVGLIPTFRDLEFLPIAQLPFRFGYEGTHGFWDLGVSVTYVINRHLLFPLPEIRGGIRF